MTPLTRISFLSVFLLALFLNSASSVAALSFDFFSNKTGAKQNVSKTVDAVVKSSQEGIPSLESNVDNTLLSLQSSALIFIAGPDTIEKAGEGEGREKGGMSEEQRRIVQERYGGGAINSLTTAMGYLYTPPASSRTYVADVLESAHVIPQAQAQGLGFSALDPILDTWKIFRNVAYLFFVVIFLVIGFMIMFRQKIGGQTVVTAQQAIPGVIVSLLFVTFSYAIAGFLIDLMYLLMYLMIGIFPLEEGVGILSQNIFKVGWDLVAGSEGAFQTVNSAVNGFVSEITVNSDSSFLGAFAGITLALIIAIAVLIGIFKLFFELLKTYVTLIVSIAVAPLMLMLGAIPGKNNFTNWLKIISGNLMAFPAVLLALILFKMFTQQGSTLDSGGFVPPFLLGGGQGAAVLTLVGIGIILIMPEIVKEVKKVMGAEGGLFEQLAGAAISQAQEGSGLGMRTVGGVGGAALGAGYGGLREAIVRSKELQQGGNLTEYLAAIGQGSLRKGRNFMATGTRVGGSIASATGAKSPGPIANVEKAVEKAGTYFSDAEILSRIENKDTNKERPWIKQMDAAKQRREVKRRQAEEGLLGPSQGNKGNKS